MRKPTLVILAAGMGSRYGGLKQIDIFTNEGETIIDFSLYDAIRVGFGKVVFVIRKSFKKEFKKIFGEKLKGQIEVDYVYQEVENLPKKYINANRIKPWGTGHALLMAKDAVKENFAVINADDFYGAEAFESMAKQLMQTEPESYNFSSIAYLLKNTISDYGYVSRGECQVNKEGFLTDITEHTHIEEMDGKLMRKDDDGQFIEIDENTVVSMNFFGFTPKFFEFANRLFEEFLKKNNQNLKAEFYMPAIVNEMLKSKLAKVKVLKSDAKWFGVTYKEEKEIVKSAIEKLKNKGVYPAKLWETNKDD